MSTQADLTRQGLEALLGALDADPKRAGAAYEQLHARLVRLFQWRRCAFPESLADETLDRVARQLADGLVLHEQDPVRYATGVAYRIFQETVRHEIRERTAADAATREPPAATSEEATERERDLTCLDRCLDQLDRPDHALVLGFYAGASTERIAVRKALAARLGMTRNALRIRACRLRSRLERCVRACLDDPVQHER